MRVNSEAKGSFKFLLDALGVTDLGVSNRHVKSKSISFWDTDTSRTSRGRGSVPYLYGRCDRRYSLHFPVTTFLWYTVAQYPPERATLLAPRLEDSELKSSGRRDPRAVGCSLNRLSSEQTAFRIDCLPSFYLKPRTRKLGAPRNSSPLFRYFMKPPRLGDLPGTPSNSAERDRETRRVQIASRECSCSLCRRFKSSHVSAAQLRSLLRAFQRMFAATGPYAAS